MNALKRQYLFCYQRKIRRNPGKIIQKKWGRQQMEAYFPMFINIAGQKILVVGAGTIATRRAEVLADFDADVLVVAPDGTERMRELEREGRVSWQRRLFAQPDLEEVRMVVTATDDMELNNTVAAACRERKIPVNHAGDKAQSDFYFPGVAREGSVVVGVIASGKDHRLARKVTAGVREWLGEFLEENP